MWYLVGQGETLQLIAAHCTKSQASLVQLNKLANPNAITAGQIIQTYPDAPAVAPDHGDSGSHTGGDFNGPFSGSGFFTCYFGRPESRHRHRSCAMRGHIAADYASLLCQLCCRMQLCGFCF